jgi:predicted enzyme related to lactoylglutathione lyase
MNSTVGDFVLDPRRIVQIEIPTKDLKLSAAFYQKVFGWNAVPAEFHNRIVLHVPENCPWGISLIKSEEKLTEASGVVLYFSTVDAEEIAKRAAAFLNCDAFSSASIPSYGTVWSISDPDGHRFGLFHPID